MNVVLLIVNAVFTHRFSGSVLRICVNLLDQLLHYGHIYLRENIMVIVNLYRGKGLLKLRKQPFIFSTLLQEAHCLRISLLEDAPC